MIKFFSFFAISIFFVACREIPTNSTAATTPRLKDLVIISGETMGTTYNIRYLDPTNRDFKSPIDSLLYAINQEVSTYEESAFITQFNKSQATAISLNSSDSLSAIAAYPHFFYNFNQAKEIHAVTKGAFEPTIMPLVNYWGFGYTQKRLATRADSTEVNKLRQLVNFDKVQLTKRTGDWQLEKATPDIQLDFSSNAKGYGVDEVGRLLERNGINNYMVEIGGEVRARGKNQHEHFLRIAVNRPFEFSNLSDSQSIVSLQNRSIATSGNYRNFYKVDSLTYSHIINPTTGFPERSDLLSVSVFADDCSTADAYATAFFVLGVEKAFTLAQKLPGIDTYLIFYNKKGEVQERYTPGLEGIFDN